MRLKRRCAQFDGPSERIGMNTATVAERASAMLESDNILMFLIIY